MNTKQTRVVFYGDSILLAGFEMTLRNDSSFLVVRRLKDIFELEQMPRSQYDLVVFDSTLPEAKIIPVILDQLSDLIIVGVDIPSARMTLFSGKEHALANIANFSKLVCNLSSKLE